MRYDLQSDPNLYRRKDLSTRSPSDWTGTPTPKKIPRRNLFYSRLLIFSAQIMPLSRQITPFSHEITTHYESIMPLCVRPTTLVSDMLIFSINTWKATLSIYP